MDIESFIANTGWRAIVQTADAAVTTDGGYPICLRIVYHTPKGWYEHSMKMEWLYRASNTEKVVALCAANEAQNIAAIRKIISNFHASLISHPPANQQQS